MPSTTRKLLRQLALVLPLAVVFSGLPIVKPEVRPDVRQWAVSLDAAGAVEAPDDFGLVGVTWPATSEAPDEVHVRTSLDGRRWGRWTTVGYEPDVGPDLGSGEGNGLATTEPAWAGRGRFVDVRFTGSRPLGAKAVLIDPGPDPSAPISSAAASPSKPGIITRAQWGANESIRRDAPDYATSLKLAIIHHTATSDSYAKSESDNIVRSIYAYHVNTNGWDDIGYNFLVDRYGQIFEGRYGGVDKNVIGAHSMGFNTYSTGIAVIGNFAGAMPPAATQSSLKRITSWRLDQGYVDPKGTVNYVSGGSNKYPQGTKVTLRNVSAHRDVGQTACPGNPIYNWLPTLAAGAAADGLPKLYGVYTSRPVITPNGDGVADGLSVRGRFSSSSSWKIDVLDRTGKVLQSTSGFGTTFQVPWYGKVSGVPQPHDDYRFRIAASNSVGTVRTAYIPFKLWRYPNGTYFLPKPSGRSYILYRNELRHPTVAQARATRYRSSEIVTVSDVLTEVYPVGHLIGFREGSIVRVDGKIYLISDGHRRQISATTMKAMGYSSSAIIETTAAAVSPHPLGETVRASGGFPDGTTVRSSTGSTAWILDGVARPLATSNIRSSWLIRSVDLAGPADSTVAAGAGSKPIGFRDGTLAQVGGEGTIYVIADGRRRPISSRAFAKMGYDADNIRSVTPAELALNPEGDPL